mmetsp:Transcript_53437/g.111559  ORF Transcript_53437/g.111559 Transcript_53437/m.111559 type:complete len:324 (+) Transcript_53437:196-1167(+)
MVRGGVWPAIRNHSSSEDVPSGAGLGKVDKANMRVGRVRVKRAGDLGFEVGCEKDLFLLWKAGKVFHAHPRSRPHAEHHSSDPGELHGLGEAAGGARDARPHNLGPQLVVRRDIRDGIGADAAEEFALGLLGQAVEGRQQEVQVPGEVEEEPRLALLQGLVDALVEVGLCAGADGVLRHVQRVQHHGDESLRIKVPASTQVEEAGGNLSGGLDQRLQVGLNLRNRPGALILHVLEARFLRHEVGGQAQRLEYRRLHDVGTVPVGSRQGRAGNCRHGDTNSRGTGQPNSRAATNCPCCHERSLPSDCDCRERRCPVTRRQNLLR